jgi:hypothetical protein
MIEKLCRIILDKLGTINLIDFYGGLSTIVEKNSIDADFFVARGKDSIEIIGQKLPVVCHIANAPNHCDEKTYYSVVPNSKHKGMLYFEAEYVDYIDRSRGNSNWRCPLRLIVWINKKYIDINGCMNAEPAIVGWIEQRLCGGIFGKEQYSRIDCKLQKVTNSDVLDKYDYAKKGGGSYKYWKYEAFSVDLMVRFSINNHCKPPLQLKTQAPC